MIDKISIRNQMLSSRDAIPKEIKKIKDEKIKDTLVELQAFKNAKKILFYASFRSEVDTFDLIKYSLSKSKEIYLPKVDVKNNELLLYQIKDTSELSKGYLGILEPDVSEDRRIELERLDLVIVPGVAFDHECNRLGYGKGFYDKLLTKIKYPTTKMHIYKKIGLAYEEQIIKAIPSLSHDIKMDMIITDEKIIECLN